MFLKVDYFKKFIKLNQYFKSSDSSIYVETPLSAFKKGGSMIQTVILLQKMNALCRYVLYCFMEKEPTLIHVNTARKTIGIKIPKPTNSKKTKDFVFNFVKLFQEIPESTWKYKKTGNPKEWCYDRADSFVVAKAAYKLYHEQEAK